MNEETASASSESGMSMSTFDDGGSQKTDEVGVESKMFYLARKSVLQMLRHRGYLVSESELSLPFSECLSEKPKLLHICVRSNPKKKIIVLFMGCEPIKIEEMSNIHTRVSTTVGLERLIIVLNSTMNTTALKELGTFTCPVETLEVEDLLLNIGQPNLEGQIEILVKKTQEDLSSPLSSPRLILRLRGGCGSLRNVSPIFDLPEGTRPIGWDLENTHIRKNMSTEQAIEHITNALIAIGVHPPFKWFVYVASPSEARISADQHAFFTEKHNSDPDSFYYHKVYNQESDIPELELLGKTQVADVAIMDTLIDLRQRILNGVYTSSEIVLITGDKGFRETVDDIRENEKTKTKFYFIKPSMCAPLTSGAQSILLSDVFKGKYQNWEIVGKTKAEIQADRKRNKNKGKLGVSLEYDLAKMNVGESSETTKFKQTDEGKEIFHRDPKFSLSDFVNKAKDTIQLVFSEYSKKNSATLENCNEKCREVLAAPLKNKNPILKHRIVYATEPKVEEIKLVGTTPTIIVTFTAKDIFRVHNQKGTVHVHDQEWTMQQTDAGKWSLSDIRRLDSAGALNAAVALI